MASIGDYNTIMSDHNIFNQVVYTPLSEALIILEERQKDPILMAKIEKLLKGNIPEILKIKKCGIMARQLATPNYENRAFISIANDNNLHPVFFEYFDDKFTSNNKYKHSLGQLHINNRVDKNGDDVIEKINIIDFNKNNGKKINEIKTLWNESFVDFHKKLFGLYNLYNFSFFQETDWYEKRDEKPIEFYTNFFLLISCYGILFENFTSSIDDPEGKFSIDVVLPALEIVTNLTGIKPLIVPIPPMDLESDDLWYSHLSIINKLIPIK